ncbi:MAG: hypothetical protein RJB14_2533, partial [Pseudomonadota bacterium]
MLIQKNAPTREGGGKRFPWKKHTEQLDGACSIDKLLRAHNSQFGQTHALRIGHHRRNRFVLRLRMRAYV